jgi:dCMP deaminase|tara:strand:+ start:244 stop:717 length:474 start_codon:yes stop_codon:yes gene_type:complete
MDSKIRKLQSKIETFTDILKSIRDISNSSTTKVGCMALRKDFSKIASFGYNGSYSGAGLNTETGTEEDSLDPGESGFIHAEVNMIAKFKEHDPENYIVLLTLSPCKMCTKILVNAGFKHVYWLDNYRSVDHLEIFKQCKITNGPISTLADEYHLIKD